jgi:chromosomal replication initiation ATPase DnaA
MSPVEICSIVGNVFGVDSADIRQKTKMDRGDRVVFARFAAISLTRKKTALTTTKIAHFFNLKNHATVINATHKHEDMHQTNRFYATIFDIAKENVEKSDFERLQLTEFIPFIYSLETITDEQNDG